MRDIQQVPIGEHVTVYAKPDPGAVRPYIVPVDDGTFAGVSHGHIVIDHNDKYPTNIPLDSDAFDVHDDAGNVLGVVSDDPVLETVPPDLE